MAQKTGLTGGSGGEWTGQGKRPGQNVIEPTFEEGDLQDLGLNEDELAAEPFIPDPSGYDAQGPMHEIAGRKMIRLTPQQLAEMHAAQAPGQRMVNDPHAELDHDIRSPDEMEEDARRREYEDAYGKAEADKLMKGYSAAPPPPQEPSAPSDATTQPRPSQPPRQTDNTTSKVQVAPGEVGEAVQVIEALINKAAKHRYEGDLKTSAELTALARDIIEAGKVKRVQPQKERHPALQRLLSNIGIEKIKPVTIPWMGSTWVFAPRPETMDFWVAENITEGGLDLSLILIAASLVGLGIDEPNADPPDPLWKVLNIGLTASYEMEKESEIDGVPSDTKPYTIQVYHKTCESCAMQVPVQDDTCATCGAKQDIYDVPLDLRLRYAVLMKQFLQEKLGISTKILSDLVTKMRTQMKDRRLDKEELYPLALPFFKLEKTLGSQLTEES